MATMTRLWLIPALVMARAVAMQATSAIGRNCRGRPPEEPA